MSSRPPPTTLSLVGPPRPDTVGRLRAAAVDAASSHLDDARLADVALVTSELLTNAIEYGPEGADIALELTTDNEEITVAVTNTLTGRPPPPLTEWDIAGADAPRGRGLGIVRRLAPRVIVHRTGDQVAVSARWPLGGST